MTWTTGALAGLVVLTAPAAAVELRVVTQFDDVLMAQIWFSRREEAQAMISNSTVRGRLGAIEDELREALPFGDDVILHFAEGGALLAWSDKSGVVEEGYWELIGGAAFSELCVRFGAFGLTSVCASPEIDGSAWLIETTPGNPFGLVAGEPVPGLLADGGIELTALAARHP